ncbi:hypothetical protein VSR82_32880 [Burkholderia sp. JPY481]
MAQEYTAEIGRALGWDLAHYGWIPREDAPADVREGHAAGKAHHGRRTRHPTRFERKWLQLRQNALRRGRVVHEGITAKYIEAIDHATCPVTLCEMTHGTGLDTDWSVDRVNNDGAYADGNLVVMSVRANKAKDRKGFFEVSDIVKANRDMDGLTAKEWARLKCIMLGACNTGNTLGGEFPLVTRIPNRCTRPPYHQLQHIALLLAAAESTKRNAGMRELNRVQVDKNACSLLQLAVERLRTVLKTVDYKYEACCDTTFQGLLARWVERIPVANQAAYKKTLQSMAGGENLSASALRNWSLVSGGYFAR